MGKCKCGCGERITKEGNIYINHHNRKGKKHSDETKEKISETHTGVNHYFYGKKHSDETKNKMSRSHKGIQCGEKNPFYRKKHSDETKEKMSEAKIGEKHHNWQGGVSFEPYCPKFNNELKEEIRDKFNRKCFNCGKDETDNITKTNKIRRLDIHHIDMDKEQGCNGKGWKLVPLCMSCHQKLHK